MSNPENISQVWQQTAADWLSCSVLVEKYLWENIFATGYQRPQTYIMKLNWASTAIKAHLQYQHRICKLYTVSLWILQTIRTLSWDWENGSIWAFQTHSQGAVLVPPVASLAAPPFIRHLAVGYLHLKSESANKESAFTSTDRPRSWGGPAFAQVQGVVELGKNAPPVPSFILV